MKNKNTETLDKKLQGWGARTRPDETHLNQLQARVMRNTRETLHAQQETLTTQDEASGIRWSTILGWASLGAAAAAFVIAAFSWDAVRDGQEVPTVAQNETRADPFSAEQIAAREVIFGELDALFDGALRWVKMQADQFSFDFATAPVRKQESPVALRTVVSKRSAETSEWVPLFHADILMPTDEYVSLEKPGMPHSHLGLWVHRLPDGNYIVQTDIQEAEYSSNSQILKLQAGSSTAEIISLKSGDTQYRISQSLAVLSPEGRKNET